MQNMFKKGHPSYATPESIKKVKNTLKKFWTQEKREIARSDALKRGNGKWMIGKKHSLETIQKMMGRKAWNKGQKTSENTKMKQSISAKNHPNNTIGKNWKVNNWGNRKGISKEGLTLNQYKEKVAGRSRPDRCEICDQGKTKGTSGVINFDHCHKTGKFRGWICWRCNLILGHAKDDKELLLKLVKYLEQHAN